MEKRIVIAGCRWYNDYKKAAEFLDASLKEIEKEYSIIILSGGASGADSLGERYAIERGFPLEKHPANWKTYGRSAGPKRNKKMAELCDVLICFWDGKSKGTKSMIECTKKLNKPVILQLLTP